MEYILGLLFGVVFFALFVGALYAGVELGMREKKSKPIEVDETEQQKRKDFDKYFKDIMSYDTDIALQRKKVTDE